MKEGTWLVSQVAGGEQKRKRMVSTPQSLFVCFSFFQLLTLLSSAEFDFDTLLLSSLKYKHRRSIGKSGDAEPRGSSNNQIGLSSSSTAVFATENSTVIVAQTGSTATLPCTIRKFGTGVVSWIRRRDLNLLTVGLATYSSDDRFSVDHIRHLQNWGLQIKFVEPDDAGMYECQISTHPAVSIFVELKVIEAIAEIVGAPDLHIKGGSRLRLVCALRDSTEPPVFVFWYHGPRMINYDRERGVTVRSDLSGSVLTVEAANTSDSGNYTCTPSNARPASINVHVLNVMNGEKPAAMHIGSRSGAASPFQRDIFYIFLLIQVFKTVHSILDICCTSSFFRIEYFVS
ncbi:cell surface A33 antigen [Bemisia tabaci]